MTGRDRLRIDRRRFLKTVAGGAAATTLAAGCTHSRNETSNRGSRPNLVFMLADEWRAQATGYAGDVNALTPNLNRLAADSVNFTHAVSGFPVCCPYRASLMTGQYWLTHGVFLNDVSLGNQAQSFAEALVGAGYHTGYIGKWHLDGHGRSNFIPSERRHGFEFWRAQECTHDYNNSYYYADTDVRLKWDGYDAIAQTREAQRYIHDHANGAPFALFLSWGPPHDPYNTAPEEYRRMFPPERIALRENVPPERAEIARKELAGYYAHIVALDTCIGDLIRTLDEEGIENDTILVFTSDHGDMLHSQGSEKKQQPWDESIRVPFLIRYPTGLGHRSRRVKTLINAPDIMPTLLGLCHVEIPTTVEGRDFSNALVRGKEPEVDAALLMCPSPFGQWTRERGGREYRGIRTARYTYARDLNGPWLLYDNEGDPFQRTNLCGASSHAKIQAQLDRMLTKMLATRGDEFRQARYYIDKWGYTVDERGTVPYTP